MIENYQKEWAARTVDLVNKFCDQVAVETEPFPNADMPGTIFGNALCLTMYTLAKRAGLDRTSAQSAVMAAFDCAKRDGWFPEDKAEIAAQAAADGKEGEAA